MQPPRYALTAYDADETATWAPPDRTFRPGPGGRAPEAAGGRETPDDGADGRDPDRLRGPRGGHRGPRGGGAPGLVPGRSGRGAGFEREAEAGSEMRGAREAHFAVGADAGVWAFCEDAQDLCADPPPPARARFDLLGCAPEGALRAALTALVALPCPPGPPGTRAEHSSGGARPEHSSGAGPDSSQGGPFAVAGATGATGAVDVAGDAGVSGGAGVPGAAVPDAEGAGTAPEAGARDARVRAGAVRGSAAVEGDDPVGDADGGAIRGIRAGAVLGGSAPLGGLVLETLDRSGKPVAEWRLTDVRLLQAGRGAGDPALCDLTIEAVVGEDQPDYPYRPPFSRGYRLLGTARRPFGHCRDLAAGREPAPEPEEPPIRMLGCSVRGSLRAALVAGDEELGHARILRLDALGRTLQYAAEGEVTAWMPSSRGRGLVDLTIEPWSQRPPLAAGEVWALWSQGRPTRANLWARCGTEGRRFWLATARDNDLRHPVAPEPPSGATRHLDGRHITDEPGFYCALGEAMTGPGGYFGDNAGVLVDLLCGGFGTRPPFTLVWHDAHVARACLGVTPQATRPPAFEELLRLLARCGVEVVLA